MKERTRGEGRGGEGRGGEGRTKEGGRGREERGGEGEKGRVERDEGREGVEVCLTHHILYQAQVCLNSHSLSRLATVNVRQLTIAYCRLQWDTGAGFLHDQIGSRCSVDTPVSVCVCVCVSV